jgi:tetratricopeptide (TPR) repeat protein
LATALNVLQRHDESVVCYEEALALDPAHVEAYYGLGAALQGQMRFDEASACFQRALAIDPGYAEAHCSLASVFQAQKQATAAIASYEKALAIDPDYPEAQFGLATVLQTEKRYEEAIACYERALVHKPDYVEAYRNIGVALQAVNRHEEAVLSFEEALAIKPSDAETQTYLGFALQEIGRIDDARRAFAKAVYLEPDKPRRYFGLVNSARMTADDPALAAMNVLARDPGPLSPDERVQLHFALGKALSDVGEHQRSFDHLLEGNRLKRHQTEYDERTTRGVFDSIRQVFTPELMRAKGGAGHPSGLPVFIVGMPRSGSTLAEHILASHSRVFGAGERDDFRSVMVSIGADTAAAPFPNSVPGLTSKQLHALAATYLARLERAALAGRVMGSDPPQRIIDKTLIHFGFVGLIRLTLPNARIIHTCRDPLDTCLSCFSKLFEGDQPFSYDLGELGRYYRAYHQLMQHWRTLLPPGAMLDVQYESLVTDFEKQARNILAFCGLEWDEACLSFYETKRVVRTASVVQVRQPIFRSSISRWRPDDDLLRPLITGLGPDLFGDD